MDEKYISVTHFCTVHHLEYSFIHSLAEHGLVRTLVIEDDEYIERERLRDLERIMRLHYDLEINLEGIDAINNLLERVNQLQQEVQALKNELSRYKG